MNDNAAIIITIIIRDLQIIMNTVQFTSIML